MINEKLGAVIAYNRALQCRARELNTRAGENVFPVMSQEEWESWLAVRLNGARRVGEIVDFESLRLPELDQEIVNLILADSPDTIEVLGRIVSVEYRSGYAPRLRMDFLGDESRNWLQLPDCIRLPGGREVEVHSAVEGYNYGISANSSQFKEKVRERLNQRLWEKWAKPVIAIPNLSVEGATIPEIIKQEYGKCAVSEDSLFAYGTVIAYRYWSNDPVTWKFDWYRDIKTAEEYKEKAEAALVQFQSEERKKRQFAEAKTEAEVVKSKIGELYRHSDNSKLEQVLMDKLNRISYGYLPSGLEELQNWTIETRIVCLQVEAAYAEIQSKRDQRSKEVQIPQSLLKAFNGDEDRAYEFMQKVAAIPANRLDQHIVQNCGRARVQAHLIEVSGDQNFFMGADPNAVKFYVSQVHYGFKTESYESEENSETIVSVSEGLGSLADAFKKAGLA